MLINKAFTEKQCYKKIDIIEVLDKLKLNSLIYQDSEGKYCSELGKALLAWDDQKFKTKALKLLVYLKDNNRFLKKSSIEYVKCDSIEYLINILLKTDIEAFIAEQEIESDGSPLPFECVKPKEMVISKFYEKIEENEKVTVSGTLRKTDEFEKNILIPILENSKNRIEIYDRFIGRSGVNKQKQLSLNYKKTLEFIIDCFLKITDDKKVREFKLVTGTKDYRNIRDIERCLGDLMSTYDNRVNFNYRIELKDESRDEKRNENEVGELDHDRFLFTNVFDYKFEEGFGFIHGNGISSFKINHIKKGEARQVQNKAKALDTLLVISNKNKN